MTNLSITCEASKLSRLFDIALFGSTPQFPDNWIAFGKEKVLIADLSMNALVIHAEFSKSLYKTYEVPETLDFGITSDLQKTYRKIFGPTEEVNFTVNGLDFTMASEKGSLKDQLKKASSPHVTPDKFPTKIIHDAVYGPVMEKVHAKLADFNKIQIDSTALSALPDTNATDFLFKITEGSLIVNQESADTTWKLDNPLTMAKQEYVKDLSVKITKNNFNTALSLHEGLVWLLCVPTIMLITSETPDYTLLTAVGTKKTQSAVKSEATPPPTAPATPPTVTPPPVLGAGGRHA